MGDVNGTQNYSFGEDPLSQPSFPIIIYLSFYRAFTEYLFRIKRNSTYLNINIIMPQRKYICVVLSNALYNIRALTYLL